MKKITLLFLIALTSTLGLAQNLITNPGFDDATGWTPFEIHAAGLNIGTVTIAGGVATFTEVDDPEWTHLGIATSVSLNPGAYQFDMDVSFDGVADSWGEVFVGTTMPAPNTDYTDNQILRVHHTWDCGAVTTYSGYATGTGCDSNPDPGKFTITTAGTYYVVYKAGGSTIGASGIVIDNMSLVSADPSPVADFTVVTSTSNLDAIFTNSSTDSTGYSWDFGDGNSSTDENPTHTYSVEGPYTVTLTATNAVGSSQSTKSIIVGNPTNFITNGTFDDATGWTVVNHYEATNTDGMVTIAGGTATWTEVPASGWKHMGIYSSVYLEIGTYQFDMNMTYTDINDIWGEVYLGTTEPVQNADYTDNQILKAFNAWDCGNIKTYSGSAAGSGCDGSATPGQFDITTAGTYYLLFRTGGATYGPTGIVIDNMTLYEKQVLSISDFTIEGLKVYPNPTNHAWTISTTDQIIETVEIFNILGNRVISLEPNALSTKVDASHLAPGVYFSTISTQLGTTSRKLIKR